ncbi:hypothetical protein FKP32DRAFT_1559931 [Trametes sanguinea]|nr:hypothetical protein FKP32DRAFT_1559931 [Trametes sanguinea]
MRNFILRRILRFCDVGTLLLTLRPVSREVRVLVERELRARLRRIVRSFTSNAEEFIQRVMRRHHIVIGGSAALRFLHPEIPAEGDYDLYLPSRELDSVLAYLQLFEGFSIVSVQRPTRPPSSCLSSYRDHALEYTAGVACIVKIVRHKTFVDLICSGPDDVSITPILPLVCSWSSLTMNYLSSDTICCAYPTLTLRKCGLVQWDCVLHPSFPEGSDPVALNKYCSWGFEICQYAHEWDEDRAGRVRPCRRSWLCPLRERYIGDQGCLCFPFEAGGTLVGKGTVWCLGGNPCPYDCIEPMPVPPYYHSPSCNCA